MGTLNLISNLKPTLPYVLHINAIALKSPQRRLQYVARLSAIEQR
ncbi:hypothetical protein MITS9509_01029 [Synechococcus sp. MIT S9509]|nr:hypothetical protein MITS9509_01029 [Synechococcus sp. MIT S9509]